MKVYEGKDVRNVGVVGHLHSGKTMLTAALLHTAGATSRLTRPDEGNTVTDFDEEEVSRKITISSALAFAEWNRTKVNLLDTPGFNLFLEDTREALMAADAALAVIDGVAGVEVQTEKVLNCASEFQLPRAFVVNKLDREHSDFLRSLESVRALCGRGVVPIHLPIGSEKNFTGIVDLISLKAYRYAIGGSGRGVEQEIPADMAEPARQGHETLVEMAAEGKDELLEEFFETGTLPLEHIKDGMRQAISELRMSPVLCAAAGQNIGADLLLDFLVEYFPAPTLRQAYEGDCSGSSVKRLIRDSEPQSVFVFKTVADPFAGRVSYFKVISGVLHNDDHLLNVRSQADERLAHIGCLLGKSLQEVPELHAGDIGAVAKLKDTLTGDTLAIKTAPIRYRAVEAPEPSIAFAIEPRSRSDEDRLGNALHKILEEDRSLRFYRDPMTQEFLLAGSGQQHVEVIVSRLKRRYGVDVALHAPKIPYRETVRGRAEVQGRHKKQTGGHGQFGDCWIRLEPLERGSEFEFSNAVFGGAIPRNFIPAIEKGILEAAGEGYLAGYPVVDFRVTVIDGSYHDVDSSEMAFKLAARKAFRLAMEQARPALLEPVMQVEVQAPVEYAGDLMGDLNGRRGRIAGLETKGHTQLIKALVPMAEMLSYQNDLVSMTQGRASFHMEFDHYDYVPQLQADKVVAAARAGKNKAHEEDD